MPGCLECEVLQKERYINPLTTYLPTCDVVFARRWLYWSEIWESNRAVSRSCLSQCRRGRRRCRRRHTGGTATAAAEHIKYSTTLMSSFPVTSDTQSCFASLQLRFSLLRFLQLISAYFSLIVRKLFVRACAYASISSIVAGKDLLKVLIHKCVIQRVIEKH